MYNNKRKLYSDLDAMTPLPTLYHNYKTLVFGHLQTISLGTMIITDHYSTEEKQMDKLKMFFSIVIVIPAIVRFFSIMSLTSQVQLFSKDWAFLNAFVGLAIHGAICGFVMIAWNKKSRLNRFSKHFHQEKVEGFAEESESEYKSARRNSLIFMGLAMGSVLFFCTENWLFYQQYNDPDMNKTLIYRESAFKNHHLWFLDAVLMTWAVWLSSNAIALMYLMENAMRIELSMFNKKLLQASRDGELAVLDRLKTFSADFKSILDGVRDTNLDLQGVLTASIITGYVGFILTAVATNCYWSSFSWGEAVAAILFQVVSMMYLQMTLKKAAEVVNEVKETKNILLADQHIYNGDNAQSKDVVDCLLKRIAHSDYGATFLDGYLAEMQTMGKLMIMVPIFMEIGNRVKVIQTM